MRSELLGIFVQLVFGAGLAAGGRWTTTQFRVRRPARRIWRHSSRRPFHIFTGHDASDLSEFTVKVYPAEYLAASEVRVLLNDNLKVDEVHLSTALNFRAEHSLTDNIVCIGGPVHNEATALFLSRLKNPIEFDGFDVVSPASGERYEAELDVTKGKIRRDVGVVVTAQNPFNAQACIILLMGARTFGCAAAAQFVTSGNLKRTDDYLGDVPTRWAILDVDVIDDFVAGISVLEATGMTPALTP